jgi:hypothetical protein
MTSEREISGDVHLPSAASASDAGTLTKKGQLRNLPELR